MRGGLKIGKGDVNLLIVHTLNMDLKGYEKKWKITASQWDAYTRQIRMRLFSGNNPWMIPEGAAALVCYRKPDGTWGEYDVLPNGEAAWSGEGNELRILLAPQIFTAVGTVNLYVRLVRADRILNTFGIEVDVVRSGSAGERMDSENYRAVTGVLPAPACAEEGQYIRVLEVDDRGRVLRVEAADLQTVGGVDLVQIRRIVEAYLEENPPAANGAGIVNITIEEV